MIQVNFRAQRDSLLEAKCFTNKIFCSFTDTGYLLQPAFSYQLLQGKTSGHPVQGVKKLQTILLSLPVNWIIIPFHACGFLTVECKFEALSYNVVNNHGYHNVY